MRSLKETESLIFSMDKSGFISCPNSRHGIISWLYTNSLRSGPRCIRYWRLDRHLKYCSYNFMNCRWTRLQDNPPTLTSLCNGHFRLVVRFFSPFPAMSRYELLIISYFFVMLHSNINYLPRGCFHPHILLFQ